MRDCDGRVDPISTLFRRPIWAAVAVAGGGLGGRLEDCLSFLRASPAFLFRAERHPRSHLARGRGGEGRSSGTSECRPVDRCRHREGARHHQGALRAAVPLRVMQCASRQPHEAVVELAPSGERWRQEPVADRLRGKGLRSGGHDGWDPLGEGGAGGSQRIATVRRGWRRGVATDRNRQEGLAPGGRSGSQPSGGAGAGGGAADRNRQEGAGAGGASRIECSRRGWRRGGVTDRVLPQGLAPGGP
ncbi:hypothetical protein NQZ70_04355 [Sorangium sp. Soce836]|nr:hypothetical protein NQZ70_04355 [Sorangium sp. Soce836]